MVRKTAPAIIEHNTQIAAVTNEMSALSAAIIEDYGHGVPYSREHYLNKARGHIMRSAEEALELGRCLIVLKEHEPHGEWLPILSDLGVDHTFAKRTMQAAVKFGNVTSSKKVIEAAKSKSKLFELLVLDDEQLEQLNDGQTVAGINLDDIDKMPVSSLRKALREAQQEMEAKEQVLADKNKKIEKQAEQLKRIKKMPPDEVATQLRTEITAMQSALEEELRVNFYTGLQTLLDHGGEDHQQFINAQLKLLVDTVKFLHDEFSDAGLEWEGA